MKNNSMKKLLFPILICCVNFAVGQQDHKKSTDGLILGYYNDSLFNGTNSRTLVLLDPNTNELTVTLYKEGLRFVNDSLRLLFDKLKGDISIEFIIDSESLADKVGVFENVNYKTIALVKINGKLLEINCSYSVKRFKTNNPLFQDLKLTLNVMINRTDFGIDSDLKISEELEIEIADGTINIK